jgi:hypothetical protein
MFILAFSVTVFAEPCPPEEPKPKNIVDSILCQTPLTLTGPATWAATTTWTASGGVGPYTYSAGFPLVAGTGTSTTVESSSCAIQMITVTDRCGNSVSKMISGPPSTGTTGSTTFEFGWYGEYKAGTWHVIPGTNQILSFDEGLEDSINLDDPNPTISGASWDRYPAGGYNDFESMKDLKTSSYRPGSMMASNGSASVRLHHFDSRYEITGPAFGTRVPVRTYVTGYVYEGRYCLAGSSPWQYPYSVFAP